MYPASTRTSQILRLLLSLTDSVTAVERKDNGLESEGDGEKVFGTREGLLQIYHLRTGSRWEVRGELEVYRDTRE